MFSVFTALFCILIYLTTHAQIFDEKVCNKAGEIVATIIIAAAKYPYWIVRVS